jgi:hypothetical protein
MAHAPRCFDVGLELRRRAEYESCRNRAELDEAERRWKIEDAAAEQAASAASDWRDQELHELRARVHRLEHFVEAPDDGLVELLAHVIRDAKKDLLGQIERRNLMSYRGVWSADTEYPAGSFVTDAGGGWVATGDCEKGSRPGKGPNWRLAIKGSVKEPVLA